MRENINQVAQRGEALDSLHDKTGKLFIDYIITNNFECIIDIFSSFIK